MSSPSQVGAMPPRREGTAPPLSLGQRVATALVFLACLGVLIVAAMLKPASAGGHAVGTHTQMGLPECGFLQRTGMPCATCGMTTSFSLAAEGRLIDAMLTQPAGAILALATAMLVLVSGWLLIAGRSILPVLQSLLRPRLVIIASAVVLMAWAYKIYSVVEGHP